MFEIHSVRVSRGIHTYEGSFADKSVAMLRLEQLGEDPDCLIAEISGGSAQGAGFVREVIVAQSERTANGWLVVEGELRCRTDGGEAKELLARHND